METIALIRQGMGLDFDVTIDRVFRSEDSAHKYANAQYKNVRIVKIEGKHKVGTRFNAAEYAKLNRKPL